MLIVYSGIDEVLVCKPKHEKKMLKIWFKKGGRKHSDYDRNEARDVCVRVSTSPLSVEW